MILRLFSDGVPAEEPDLFEELGDDPVSEAQARSSLHGKEFDQEAFGFLERCGAGIRRQYPIVFPNYRVDAEIEGSSGARFFVVAHGTPDRTDRPNAGLRRQDTVLKLGFRALRLHQRGSPLPLLVLTSHLPKPGTSSAFFLAELAAADAVFDVVATWGDPAGERRLDAYLNAGSPPDAPLPAPWRATQLSLADDPFAEADPGA